MTVLTKEKQQKLKDAVSGIYTNLRAKLVFSYDTEKLACLFMTPADYGYIQNFFKLYEVDLSYSSPTIEAETTFNHPVAGQVTHGVSFQFRRVPGGDDMVWPKASMKVRADCDEALLREVTEGLADYVQAKVDLHIYKKVLDWVTSLKHIEEMRYLFPHITRVFQFGGMRDIANRLSEVRRPPSSFTPMDPEMRKFLKHVNNWIAMHELIGTFDMPFPVLPMRNTKVEMGEFYLLTEDGDGKQYELRVEI